MTKLVRDISFILTGLAVGLNSSAVWSKEYFNPNALSYVDDLNIADIDNLDQFSADGQLPGVYNVTVFVNGRDIGVKEIEFKLNDDNQLVPELTKSMLANWGVKTDVIPSLKSISNNEKFTDLSHYIEYANTDFVFSKQALNVTIPQVAMRNDVKGSVDPSLYDQGVPAILLNYDFNGAKMWNKNGVNQNDQFLNLRSGINLGAWRLRNYSTYEHNNNVNHWNSLNTYLERDIQPLKSQLTIGESTTTGEIFTGFQFKGVKLASDEGMLPYSLRGFAPVVRGFAQTNAKVTVRQNGAIIYQTYVSPGPFALTDLYPTSYSGNLDVTVDEEDGSKQSFIVPFASLAIMQREGGLKYSVTAGQYRTFGNGKQPNFVEGTLIYGLPWNTTLFGGTIYSKDYQSYAIGLGFNLGDFGAISIDGKQAYTQFDFEPQKQSGQAYRLQYSKTLEKTNSTISFEAYRYSSKGFYDFSEANENQQLDLSYNRRSRYQLNLNQSFSDYGSLYVSAYQQDYWNSSKKDRNINIGYNIVVHNISYGLSYGYTKSSGEYSDTHQVSFRVNIPLGNYAGTNNYLTSNVNYSNQGKAVVQAGLSGNALNNDLTYSIQQNYSQQNRYVGGNAAINYQGSEGNVNLGYSYNEDSRRLNYGVQGGVVVHPYGVTLSQPLNDTIAVIAAPGAKDVPVENTQGIETNRWGYAVKTYLTPYAENTIGLNIDNLGNDVDIVNNAVNVVPTKGAVVIAKINTHVGYRVLMTLTSKGQPLPFGTVVALDGSNGESNGIVGDNGEVYLSGMPQSGTLTATWGKEVDQTCQVHYSLSKDELKEAVKIISADCTQ